MCDNFCLFWTYATLNGIPTLPSGCQALTALWWRIGREGKSFGCGYPPSIARSQKAEGGILGINTEEEGSPAGLLFYVYTHGG